MSIHKSDIFGWGPRHPLPNQRLQYLLKFISGHKIIDIGCGPGHFVNFLTLKNYQVTGVDKSKFFINFAKKNYHGRFINTSAYHLPFRENSFDTAYLTSVIEHLSKPVTALKDAFRVAKKVVVTVPLQTPLSLSRSGVVYFHHIDPSHLRYYNLKLLKNTVKKSGGIINKIAYTERLPNRELFAKLLKLPPFFQKLIAKIIFSIFKPKKYYLEITASCQKN